MKYFHPQTIFVYLVLERGLGLEGFDVKHRPTVVELLFMYCSSATFHVNVHRLLFTLLFVGYYSRYYLSSIIHVIVHQLLLIEIFVSFYF